MNSAFEPRNLYFASTYAAIAAIGMSTTKVAAETIRLFRNAEPMWVVVQAST